MAKQSKRYVLGDLTRAEVEVLQLRTSGVSIEEIAVCMDAKLHTTRWRLGSVMRKVGVSDIATLTRWAIENALDEPLEPESANTLPESETKQGQPRMRRSRTRSFPPMRTQRPKFDLEAVLGMSRK